MNLRELAEKDLSFTLESDEYGSACDVMFIAPDGNEYEVSGWVNDIGFGYDTDGVAVATRTVCVMWRMSSMMNNNAYVIPGRGWECHFTDLSGKEWTCAITRCEPDRTLGIGRCWLSLDLSEDEN